MSKRKVNEIITAIAEDEDNQQFAKRLRFTQAESQEFLKRADQFDQFVDETCSKLLESCNNVCVNCCLTLLKN